MLIHDYKELKKTHKVPLKRLIALFLFIVITGTAFLGYTTVVLYNDKMAEDSYWEEDLKSREGVEERAAKHTVNATPVTVGTYVENLKEISIKSSYFRVVSLVWFRWEGRDDLDMANNFHIYKGMINKTEKVKEYHKDGVNYQLLRCDITVTKNYWTKRFPLESHQLRFYIESNYLVNDVVFVGDKENSGYNGGLAISGFDLKRYDNNTVIMEYDNGHLDPEISDTTYTSEFVTAMEVNRASWGLYVKCFIALVGTSLWVMIVLFLNTFHHVDPLGMIPAALFGTVSNIMVGANLLPDALQTGLLEYVNIWGIFTILAVTLSIININRIRNKHQDKEYAAFLGRVMFVTIIVLVLAGHIIMPIASYLR